MTLKQQEKRAYEAMKRYNTSKYCALFQAYSNPSYTKVLIVEQIISDMKRLNGGGFKIISKNTFMFTCGFIFPNEKTGELMFSYYTPNYNVVIPYSAV